MTANSAESPAAGKTSGAGCDQGLTVFHLYAVLVALRFLASLLLSEPVILPDELAFQSMARGFFATGHFGTTAAAAIGAPTGLGYVLYPTILSVAFLFNDNFLVAGKLLNALLINAAIFPFNGILRGFLPKRGSAWAAALPLLLPSFGFSAFLMAENVAVPLSALGLFLLYRLFTRRRAADAVLSAVALMLLFLSKHQASAWLAAVPVVALLLIVGRPREQRERGCARRILAGLGLMALTLAAAGFVFNLAVPGSVRRMSEISWTVAKSVGLPLAGGTGGGGESAAGFLRMAAAHLAAVLVLALVPILIVVWTWRRSRRSADPKPFALTTLVLVLGLTLFATTLVATSAFAPAEGFARLHGRFYAPALCFLLVVFAAFGERFAWTPKRKLALSLAAAGAVAATILTLPWYLVSPAKSALVVDYPELGWTAFSGPGLRLGALALFVLTAAAILITGKSKAYLGFFLALIVASNAVQYRVMIRSFEPDRAASKTARAFIAGCIRSPDASVAVFGRDALPRHLLAFWRPYRYTLSADLPPDGLLKRRMIPAGSEYAVVFGEHRLDFKPFRDYQGAGCSVLVLTDRVSVLRDFAGVHHDAPAWTWTGRTFSYFPDGPFRTLVLDLNERRPFQARMLFVETKLGTKRIRLDDGTTTIELPYSPFYRFRLDRVFNPRRRGLNPEDSRALGISLKDASILY